jgi:hypothetical protein
VRASNETTRPRAVDLPLGEDFNRQGLVPEMSSGGRLLYLARKPLIPRVFSVESPFGGVGYIKMTNSRADSAFACFGWRDDPEFARAKLPVTTFLCPRTVEINAHRAVFPDKP